MDLSLSYIESEMLTLHLVMTAPDQLQSLLSLHTSGSGGLSVSGWLESSRGQERNLKAEQEEDEAELVFNIVPGVEYQLGETQSVVTSSRTDLLSVGRVR